MSGTFDDVTFALHPTRTSILASLKTYETGWFKTVEPGTNIAEILTAASACRTKTELTLFARQYRVDVDDSLFTRDQHADVAYGAAEHFLFSTFPTVRTCVTTMDAAQRSELAARAIPAAVAEAFTHRHPVVFLHEVLPEALFPGDGPGVPPSVEAPHEIDAAVAAWRSQRKYADFAKFYSSTWRAAPTRAARDLVTQLFVETRDAAKRYAEAEALAKTTWLPLEYRAKLERVYLDKQYTVSSEFLMLSELWRRTLPPPASL